MPERICGYTVTPVFTTNWSDTPVSQTALVAEAPNAMKVLTASLETWLLEQHGTALPVGDLPYVASTFGAARIDELCSWGEVNFCAAECGGVRAGGYCWYLGNLGESCTQTCAAHNSAFDEAGTLYYAGSEASCATHCAEVLSELGVTGPMGYEYFTHAGCYYWPGSGRPVWAYAQTTTADAAEWWAQRACACSN